MLREQSLQFRKKCGHFRVVRSRSALTKFRNAIFNVRYFHRY